MADPVNQRAAELGNIFRTLGSGSPDLGFKTNMADVEAKNAELKAYLGTTDYSAQNKEATDFAKLQFALSLMGRGFSAMGAAPKPGESALGTLGRTLVAPLAGDFSTIAGPLMKQRAATRLAEQQEDRQLKLSALNRTQSRQDQAYTDDAATTEKARQFMLNVLKKGDTVSNDYLLNGQNIPLIVRKDWTGQFEGFYEIDGKKVNNAGVKVKPDATTAVKPITSWATDVQVRGSDGNWTDAPGALRIADGTGQNSRVVFNNTTLDFNEKSATHNARIVKPASKDSPYYSPSTTSVFLEPSAISVFGLDPNKIKKGQKVTYREYLVRPDRAGPNTWPIKELVVGGNSYRFDRHPGYNPETGNITVDRGPDQAPETYEAAQLFKEEDPKSYTQVGDPLTVPSGNRLAEIRKIGGLSKITSGETLRLERNPAGDNRVRYVNQTITLSPDQAALFQTRPLDEVQKVSAGQVKEPRTSYVNTSDRTLNVGGQTLGPGQTGAFSKADINSPAFLNVSSSFREVGPVSTDLKTFMFKEPKTLTVGDRAVEYTPGDEVRYTPQEFANLPKDLQKILTDDTALQASTLKRNYFTSVWTDVTNREGLTPRDIKEQDLQSLLGMFPAGGRVGGNSLRDEIFAMIKFGPNANQGSGPTTSSAEASAQAQTYAESVQQKLSRAGKRYEIFRGKGALGDVPWETLSYERKRAFADLPEAVQLAKINSDWQGSEDRLAKDKATVKSAAPEDVASFSSAVELLILAKQLRDGHELDNSGRFTGFLGSLGVNTFGDISPLTSGGSQRLQQIINRMKASYGTLSSVEGGGGRDSVFRQQLQEGLLPAFSKPEKLNRDNISSIINRLETNIRSTFNQEITSSTVVPKAFEIMAKDAGITGVSVDQRRYRWLDPTVQESPPVTRQRVMEGINMLPFTFADATDLRVGRIVPMVAANAPDMRYVKIKNLENGEVLIQEARPDGMPKSGSPKLVLGTDMKTRLQ